MVNAMNLGGQAYVMQEPTPTTARIAAAGPMMGNATTLQAPVFAQLARTPPTVLMDA